MTPLPPRLPAMGPLPFVGVEDMEYVALTATPKLGDPGLKPPSRGLHVDSSGSF